MNNIDNQLNLITKNNTRYYSEQAIVTRIYTVKEQQELYNLGKLKKPYDINLHLTCDVMLVKDGSKVYGVKLSPVKLQTGDVILDGTPESPSGNIRVDIPAIGSYVFISYLNEEDAYVSFQSNSESIVVGNANGAFISFYTKDETRTIDLVNADKFNVQFPNGKQFLIETNTATNLTELITIMSSVLLQANKSFLSIDDDIDIVVADNGKISLRNDIDNLKDILVDTIDSINDYFKKIETILVSAGLTSIPTQNKLTNIKNRVTDLFY